MNRILNIFKIFVHGVAGSVVGAVSYPMGTLSLNKHLPSAVVNCYRSVHRATSIGPNLKAVAYVTLPIAAAATPPLLFTTSVLFGFVRGSYATAFKDYFVDPEPGFFRRFWLCLRQDLSEANDTLVTKLLPAVSDYHPLPLPLSEKPFDISPLRAVMSVLTGLVLTCFEGPTLFGVVWWQAPRIFISFSGNFLKEADDLASLMLVLLLIFLLAGFLCLLPPVVLFASICFGVGVGCLRGYRDGFKSAIAGSWNDVRSLNCFLAKMKF